MRFFIGPVLSTGEADFINGKIHEGIDKFDILDGLIHPPYFTMLSEKDPDKFMANIIDNTNKFYGFQLVLTGETFEERLDNFYRLLTENHLGKFLADDEVEPPRKRHRSPRS
jgi:hypothetical protein